jgi:hypothetical protein
VAPSTAIIFLSAMIQLSPEQNKTTAPFGRGSVDRFRSVR